MKKVLIKGCVGNRNFGDDLLIYAVSSALEEISDKCDYYFLSDDIKYLDRIVSKVKIVHPENQREKFDIVLYAGGTQFASFKNTTTNCFPSLKRLVNLMLHPKILCFKLLNRMGVNMISYEKIFLIGIGIGPFYKRDKYYNSVVELLRLSDMVIVRDVLSCEICNRNNIEYILGSDLVYSLPLNFWEKYRNNNNHNKDFSIAVVFRDWRFTDNEGEFIYKLKELSSYYNIAFFSFADYADEECCLYLKNNNFEIYQWDPDVMTLENYMSELQKYDLFVTARYHGAVVASLMKKPFITLGIEPKLEMIAELFNMPCWRFPYDVSECINYIKAIEDQYVQIQEQVELIVVKEHNKAVEMTRLMCEGILQGINA